MVAFKDITDPGKRKVAHKKVAPAKTLAAARWQAMGATAKATLTMDAAVRAGLEKCTKAELKCSAEE